MRRAGSSAQGTRRPLTSALKWDHTGALVSSTFSEAGIFRGMVAALVFGASGVSALCGGDEVTTAGNVVHLPLPVALCPRLLTAIHRGKGGSMPRPGRAYSPLRARHAVCPGASDECLPSTSKIA